MAIRKIENERWARYFAPFRDGRKSTYAEIRVLSDEEGASRKPGGCP